MAEKRNPRANRKSVKGDLIRVTKAQQPHLSTVQYDMLIRHTLEIAKAIEVDLKAEDLV